MSMLEGEIKKNKKSSLRKFKHCSEYLLSITGK